MEIPQTAKSKQDLCTISIMFPIESDEQAIAYKQKITAVMAGVDAARIQFGIMVAPRKSPDGT